MICRFALHPQHFRQHRESHHLASKAIWSPGVAPSLRRPEGSQKPVLDLMLLLEGVTEVQSPAKLGISAGIETSSIFAGFSLTCCRDCPCGRPCCSCRTLREYPRVSIDECIPVHNFDVPQGVTHRHPHRSLPL